MIYLKAVFLAVVEGITEFLPISSTGHMILVNEFLRLSEDETFTNTFMIAIQLPAVLSVVVYFWDRLWPFGQDASHFRQVTSTWGRVALAFLPTAIIGFLLSDSIEAALGAWTVAFALLIGGVVLIVLERRKARPRWSDAATLPLAMAAAIGLFQCLAMIPGTSRSAATIIGAMLLGASRGAAAEFSFFLAIPTMTATTVYSLYKHGLAFSAEQWGVIAAGSLVSFLTAYAVIAAFMRYIQSRDFVPFGYYRIVLGVVVLVYLFLRGTPDTLL